MATEQVVYITYEEAVYAHIELMTYLEETRYGVFDRGLIQSALARARQAATYDRADLVGQASTLLYGLIKNHPWIGGNKRTATMLTQLFLRRNGLRMVAGKDELVESVLAIEADDWRLPEIENWLRQHVKMGAVVMSTNYLH